MRSLPPSPAPAARPLALRLAAAVGLLLLAAGHAAAQGGGVTVVTTPTLPVSGLALEVTVSFDTPIQSASAFFRPTGSTEPYREVVGTDLGGGTSFRGTIPADLVRARGFEGYVRYVRNGVTLFEPAGAPQATPLRFPVVVPRIRSEVVLPPREYRMVSVPLQFYTDLGGSPQGRFAEVFEDDYGPYNVERWRVLRWSPTAELYLEREQAVPNVRAGEAFWLVTADGAGFDVEGAATAGFRVINNRLIQDEVRVTLPPGWNQIGNPFAFDLPWSSVEGRAQVSAPVAFRASGYEPGQSTLRPWEGYFVENRASTPVELRFRVPGGSPSVRDERPFAVRYLEALGPGGYLLQVRAEGASGRDLHTYVGVAATAGDHDLGKPPPVASGPRVAVEAEGQDWATRILPTSGPLAWTLVHSGEDAMLTLVEHGERPAGTLPVLRDAETGHVLAVGTGTVALPPSVQRFHLALVPDAEAPALPTDRWLDAVYPNPLRPDHGAATVRFWAPQGAPVVLDVHDALGRRVAYLADFAGDDRWRELAWDGRDDAGRTLPAGLYLLRLRAGEHTLTRRLTLIR